MLQEQLILIKRSLNIYNTETEAWTALDNLTHTQGQPVVAFFRRTSNTHGDTALGAIFAIGTANGVGKYKACSSHDDMLAIAQALNTHISEWTAFKDTFDKMFEYDANHKAIKAKLDFYTDSNKNISAGGLGGSSSSSLGALYQLVDVMINSTGDGVEGAVEGSVLAYDATAGKWKAIAQSEILPDMSGYYTKEETDAAINAIPIYSMAKLSASEIASLSDGANVREAYRLKKGGNNVDDTVIKIYKDSAIKSLELRDNKYLVLTYTDNEGNEQSISKDLSAIVNDNYVDLINNQEIGGIKTFTEKTIFKKDINVLGDGIFGGEVVAIAGDAEPAGVTDYAQLQGKPSINGKELASGDNTLDALGIQPKGDYTTASQLATTLADYATKVFVSNNYATKAAVYAIQALIPATATADNQLADKDFVNSSIATATAEFKGSFTSLDELKATSGNLNDYAFYLHTDDVGNKVVDRYKWTTAGWLYEYTLNNSSFTAEQWAALNSAITATLVQSYNSHLNNSTIHITADERTAWNNKWDYNEETIKAVKVNAAVLADKATILATSRSINGTSFNGSADITTAQWGDFRTIYISDATGTNTGEGKRINGSEDFTLKLPATIKADLQGNADTATNATNSDTLDGLHASSFARMAYDNNLICHGNEFNFVPSAFSGDLHINYRTSGGINGAISAYCFDDGAGNLLAYIAKEQFSGNSASATKLYTSRSIFGQPFDGSTDCNGDMNVTGKATVEGDIVCGGEVVAVAGEGTPAGVTDYSALTGKPSINGVTLVSGNNALAALGIQAAGDYATNSGVTTLLANYADKTFVSNNYVSKSVFNNHTADTNIHITSAERNAWNAKWDYNEATIKAVKVTSASSADSVAWSGIKDKPTTFTPSAHTHTASEVSGLPTKLSAFTNDVGFVTVRQKNGFSYNNLATLYTPHASIYRIDLTDVQVNIWTMLFIEVSLRQNFSPGYGGKILINLYHDTTSDFTQFNATILGNLNNIYVYSSDRRYIYISASMSYSTISVDRVLVGDNAVNADLSNITIEKVDSLPDTYQTATIYYGLHTGNFTKSIVEGVLTGDITSHTHTFASLTEKPTTISGYGITDALTTSNYNSYAPTLTGTGASGTWGINITGNAASATKLQTPRTLWGQSFNGTGNVSGGIKTCDYIQNNDQTGGFFVGSRINGLGDTAGGLLLYVYGQRKMSFYTNSINRMEISTNGNVLIGTTTDNGYKLQVGGSERVYGDLIVDGEVSALVA